MHIAEILKGTAASLPSFYKNLSRFPLSFSADSERHSLRIEQAFE